MNQMNNLIITASAGTGKTYRLAMEYVRLLLRHYEQPDFAIDSILVLTFTRKATSEIKERIVSHLKVLAGSDSDDRSDLICNLKGDEGLSTREEGIIHSVNAELARDRKLLQVMTLDAYIQSIFRNIVRPIKNISDYELDLLSTKKRMPHLMSELMKPELRIMVDKLLGHRLNPSLDYYSEFFISLIENRWLLYLEQSSPPSSNPDSLRNRKSSAELHASQQLDLMLEALQDILGQIQDHANQKNQPWELYFSSEIFRLFPRFPNDPQEFCQLLPGVLTSPVKAMQFFKKVKELKIHNGTRIRAKTKGFEDFPPKLENLRHIVSNYLVYQLFLPEMEEIQNIWSFILALYDSLLYRYKNFSYDDISWFTFEALFKGEPPNYDLSEENTANEFYEFLSHRNRFVLIDEFQDTSLMQFTILKPIINEVISGYGTKDFGGLTVVGDEKQSIFGWRGGERDLLLNLRYILPALRNCESASLTKTWRSTPIMIDFINHTFSDPAVHDYLAENKLTWNYEQIESAVKGKNHLSTLSIRTEGYKRGSDTARTREELVQDWVETCVVPIIKENTGAKMAILCRTNKELTLIQQLIEEAGEKSVFQPNAVLPSHRYVSPLISFFRWKAFGDWLDWLAWLRSDYIMLKPEILKIAIDQIALERESGQSPDFSSQPALQTLWQASIQTSGSIAEICNLLVNNYLERSRLSERDQLNLNAFLDLAQSFDLDQSIGDKGIPAWLDYLEELSGQESIKQVSIEGGDKIQLLTIHKSKGLEFDTVFVYHDLSRQAPPDFKKLDWYAIFEGNDYSTLEDFAFSYYYGMLLEYSDFSDLHQSQQRREILEEMNNLYVAFTRAATSLHILFAFYGDTDGWDSFKGNKLDSKNPLPILLCDAAIKWFDGRNQVQGLPDGEAPKADKQTQTDQIPAPYVPSPAELSPALDFLPPQPGEVPLRNEKIKLKTVWLQNKAPLIGNLSHYYLSFIIRNLPSEHKYAQKRSIAKYCSLLSVEAMEAQFARLRQNLEKHAWIFEPRWDKIYTEMPLYDDKGKEYRPDRIMLDTKTRLAWIVDYKTGVSKEEDQLDRYEELLGRQPAIRDGGYEVKTDFIKL